MTFKVYTFLKDKCWPQESLTTKGKNRKHTDFSSYFNSFICKMFMWKLNIQKQPRDLGIEMPLTFSSIASLGTLVI